MGKKLDNKEKRFVEEYMIDLKPERAAIEAGYSKTVAHTKAYQWVSNSKIKPHVYEEIMKRFQARSERTKISQDFVLEQLVRMATADIREVVGWKKGSAVFVKDSDEISDEAALMISEVAQTQHGLRVKTVDRQAALDKLARHLGMYLDRTEHSVSDDLAALLKEIDGTSRAL